MSATNCLENQKSLVEDLFESKELTYYDISKLLSLCDHRFCLVNNSHKNENCEIAFFAHFDRDGLLSLITLLLKFSLVENYKISEKISFYFTQIKPAEDLIKKEIIEKRLFKNLKTIYILDLGLEEGFVNELKESRKIDVKIFNDDKSSSPTFKIILDSITDKETKIFLNELTGGLEDIMDIILPGGATSIFIRNLIKAAENKDKHKIQNLIKKYRESVIQHHKELGEIILKIDKSTEFGIEREYSEKFEILTFRDFKYKDLQLIKILCSMLSVSKDNNKKIYAIFKRYKEKTKEKTGSEKYKYNVLIASSDKEKIEKIENILETEKITEEIKFRKNRYIQKEIYLIKSRIKAEDFEKVYNIIKT
ncbi:MAG: hypothetical protein QXS69_02185 [Candidatus Aenigmatarchaeota archaeon]